SGTPSSLYSLRLCSRSVRLLEYDTTSTMSAGGPYSRAAVSRSRCGSRITRMSGTVLGELHFKGCRERLADDMRLEVLLEPAGQLEHGALMDGAGGRRHDQLAPDDLVAQMVVGEVSDLLSGVSRHQRGHGHKMVTSRAQGQLGMGRAYRSACEARHRGYAAGGESMRSARRPDRPFGGRVNGLRAQVRA